MDLDKVKVFSEKVKDLTETIETLNRRRKILENVNSIEVTGRIYGDHYDSDFLISDRHYIRLMNPSVVAFKTIALKEFDELIAEKEKELHTLISKGVPAENGGSK